MAEIVLDCSAVLAFLAGEPGGGEVLDYPSRLICAVNHAEVIGRLTDWGLDKVGIDATLRRAPYLVEPFGDYRAEIAGRLRNVPVAKALSLGDRACLSLALQTGLPVLTADRAWADLELDVDVRLIRRHG